MKRKATDGKSALRETKVAGPHNVSEVILTTKEAADFLRIHEKTMCRLAREGKVPGNRIGGKWRFIKDDLVQWIKNGLS